MDSKRSECCGIRKRNKSLYLCNYLSFAAWLTDLVNHVVNGHELGEYNLRNF